MNDSRETLSRSRSLERSRREPEDGRPHKRGDGQGEVNSRHRLAAAEPSVHLKEAAGDNIGQTDPTRP